MFNKRNRVYSVREKSVLKIHVTLLMLVFFPHTHTLCTGNIEGKGGKNTCLYKKYTRLVKGYIDGYLINKVDK